MYSQDIIDNIVEKGIRSLRFPAEPENIYRPIGYMFGLGGKHLRPRLCLTAFNLFSDNVTDEVLFPALALEIFHQFTLVHDDIVDNSPTRRNQPTVQARWGRDIALISGDTMLLTAYRYLAGGPAKLLRPMLDLFTQSAVTVCEGQQLDLDFEKMPFVTMEEYLEMIGKKTGALIAGAVRMGALLAGAPESDCEALYRYGMETGLAFQITDDYLDTFGNEKIFGKPIGGDIANNKKSWLLVECQHRANSHPEEKARLEALMQLDASKKEEKLEGIRSLYVRLGVDAAAREAILAHHEQALSALRETSVPEEGKERMAQLAEQLIHREK